MAKQTQPAAPPVTPEERLENILKISGNNLHLRIAKVLKDAGWQVDLSAYYYDDTTEKPREIDIVAYKDFDVTLPTDSHRSAFRTSLFIDCKHFKDAIAFRRQPTKSGRKAMKAEGLIARDIEDRLYEQHHYALEEKVGKLFDTAEDLFGAITQPVKSLTFLGIKSKEEGFTSRSLSSLESQVSICLIVKR